MHCIYFDLKIHLYVGSKGAALILFILNIKKYFDYLSFNSQWYNNFE
jgi:hypothetical protein